MVLHIQRCVRVSNYQLNLLTFGSAAAHYGLDVRVCSLSVINCYLVLVLFLQSCIYLLSESNVSPTTYAGILCHRQSLCALSAVF